MYTVAIHVAASMCNYIVKIVHISKAEKQLHCSAAASPGGQKPNTQSTAVNTHHINAVRGEVCIAIPSSFKCSDLTQPSIFLV